MNKNPYILTEAEEEMIELVDYLSQWREEFKFIGNCCLTIMIMALVSILSYHYLF